MSKKVGEIDWFLCKEGHVHIVILDEDGDEMAGIALDFGEWDQFASDIDEAIDDAIEVAEAMAEAEEATKH